MATPVTQTTLTISTVEQDRFRELERELIATFIEWYNVNLAWKRNFPREDVRHVRARINKMSRLFIDLKLQMRYLRIEVVNNRKIQAKLDKQEARLEKRKGIRKYVRRQSGTSTTI